jgi:lysozyme family protein
MAVDPTKRVVRERQGGVETKAESPALREKELHLKEYLEGMEKLDPKAKRDFFAKSLEWDRNGNFEELRRAGRTASENTRDSMRKHTLLSSLYLERDQSKPGEMAFRINFGNDLARRKVGLGDMLPPRVKSVKVWDDKGAVVSEDAFRAINPETGRIGYYDRKTWEENKTYRYIPVFDDYSFTVLRTGDEKDPEVTRHRYAEHMTLYESVRVPASDTAPASTSGRRTSATEKASGGTGAVSAPPDFAPGLSGGGESVDISAARKRITDVARGYVDVPRAEFRTPDVQGGYLGCAKVVSTILKQAGFMDQVILGVDNTADYLLRKGWTRSSGPPEAGDVIVWGGMKKQIRGAVDDAPKVATGHKHIGIALGPDLAVSNSASKGMPTQHAIYVGRPVEMFLKPPQGGQKAPTASQRTAGEGVPGLNAQNHRTKDMGIIAQDHAENSKNLHINPDRMKRVNAFLETFEKNRQRYERVAAATEIPAILIAAIHNMEAGMLFNRYLHNGQPLGRETTFVPKGILFGPDQWEEAAIHALGGDIVDLKGNRSLRRFQDLRNQLGINRNTTDLGKLLALAETYNGLGYRNKGGSPSPYIYAGTDKYEKGLYVADGKFDPEARHKGIGVAAMLEGGIERGIWDVRPQRPGTAVA